MQLQRKDLLLFITLIFASSFCFSQNNHFIVIRGQIVNSVTAETISYANLWVSEKGINTMSNAEGKFYFKIPLGKPNDSVFISHVGYKQKTIVVHREDTAALVVRLEEELTTLYPINVQAVNPLELVKNAISKIPDNYPTAPCKYLGFYRLSGTKEKNVIDLSEAVFEIYSESSTSEKRQFKLIKNRSEKDLTAFNGNDNVEIGQTPKLILDFDIISNWKKSKLLGEDDLNHYHFTYHGVVNYGQQRAYEIHFDERDGIKKSLYKGKLFIDVDDLAFLAFDYGLSPKGLKYFGWGLSMNLLLAMSHIDAKLLADHYTITYRRYGSKYYLNHAMNTDSVYLAGGKNNFLLDPLVTSTNYLITGIDSTGVNPFSREEILGDKKRIESSDSSGNSIGFWENYNLIPAEFNVDSVIRVIQAHNASLHFKQALQTDLRKYKGSQPEIIDSICSFYYHKGLFNGTALVAAEEKMIYQKGFGMANKEKLIPNDGQTRFLIGSTSKQFTAMLIMQLEERGQLKLNDTVGKYIPGYTHGNVTIDQLLTHQSGIPNYTANTEWLARIMTQVYTPDQLVYQFCSDSLEFSPGTSFHYNNSGYVVLADIIEKITKKKFSEVISEQIFIPLKMKNSYFISSGHSDHLAIGYLNNQPEAYFPPENVIGAGGITSTAEDLLIWSEALFQNQLLPKEKMNEYFKARVSWKEWDAEYGYGWMTDKGLFRTSKNHTVLYHPGTEFGFYDMLVLQPDKKLALVLLNNTGEFPRFDMTDLILSEMNK